MENKVLKKCCFGKILKNADAEIFRNLSKPAENQEKRQFFLKN